MKWGILATGTIAGKFAETVNQMEDTQVLIACASRTMEKAEAFCREAYEFNSDTNVILDNMIQIHTKKGEFSEAEKYADELLAKNPNFIEGFYDIAVVFSNLGRIDEAKECLNKALEIEPSFLTNISHEMVNELLAKL